MDEWIPVGKGCGCIVEVEVVRQLPAFDNGVTLKLKCTVPHADLPKYTFCKYSMGQRLLIDFWILSDDLWQSPGTDLGSARP